MKFGSVTTGIVSDGLIFNMDAANRASYPAQRTFTIAESGSCYNTLDLTQSGSFISDPEFITQPTSASCWDFDGVDDYIDCGEIPPLFKYFPIGTAKDTAWSASMWVKGSSAGGFFEIPYVESNALNAFSFGFAFSTYLYFGGKYALIKIKESGTTAFSTTDWNHIVMTFDGVDNTALSSYTLYVGGISIPIVLITPNITDFRTKNISIGVAGTLYWDGSISNCQLYDRTLSSTDVLHNYNALKGRFI